MYRAWLIGMVFTSVIIVAVAVIIPGHRISSDTAQLDALTPFGLQASLPAAPGFPEA